MTEKNRTLENSPTKSYKASKNAANRTPDRRINAEPVHVLAGQNTSC